ncbi:YqzE family protein [Salirhabdus salicampi]|uniref:YqzE family protein n=1 Tax=Salirhabdus salicampi TaxID=476102 RepID=UPI0020C4CA12|nr:YqzE family protein [Salirhabdus salicampi]MCP8616844.1 YqzE family protein [Salirhabdus salicampi]
MASGNDIVKYMTEEIVKYAHLPRDEKKQRKQMKKLQRQNKSSRYFGLLPDAIKMYVQSKKKGS